MQSDKQITMKLKDLAEIIESDKMHENTSLALKVEDGRKRLRRIINFNQLVAKMNQAQEPIEDEVEEEPRPKPKIAPKKPVPKEKTPEEQANDDAEAFGLPKEEADLFGEEFEEK